jgi:hypothetical protein
VPVSSELPVGSDQEEPIFEEEYTQIVEDGKWLFPLYIFSFEPISPHA